MLTRQALAARLREARQKRSMTLKDVERESGFSATHISEIERGRTMPTIDALVRISSALACDPGYFLEERELAEVTVVTPEEDASARAETDAPRVRRLTPGLLGGELEAHLVAADRPYQGCLPGIESGDICCHVLQGRIEIGANGERFPLEAGSTFHGILSQAPEIQVLQVPAEMIVLAHRGPGAGI